MYIPKEYGMSHFPYYIAQLILESYVATELQGACLLYAVVRQSVEKRE